MSIRAWLVLLPVLAAAGCFRSHVECDDPANASSPFCSDAPCMAGETPTYTATYLGTLDDGSASGIENGDGSAPMAFSCAPSRCPLHETAVVLADGTSLCAPPPPSCPPGTSPDFAAGGFWHCSPPCDVIVHYGYMFSGRLVCAGAPPVCDAPLVATFDVTTEEWHCAAMCDGGTYDPVHLGSMQLCVPC